MASPLWLDPDDETTPFPPLCAALDDPNGLLAVGGPLTPARLELAYRAGIFPWYSDDQPVLWWSPDPRAVFFPGQLHLSRSLRKRLRGDRFRLSLDGAFDQVIRACAESRPHQPGTWITADMIRAYGELHRLGLAHSVEVWLGDELVGGLYGVALGRAFFGESMFSRQPDASKAALAWLSGQLLAWDYQLIDCQVPSPHLARLGARLLPRAEFERRLRKALEHEGKPAPWRFDPGFHPLA